MSCQACRVQSNAIEMPVGERTLRMMPSWLVVRSSARVVKSIRSVGGTAKAYLYKGNSHELIVDGNAPAGSVTG
jgi:hypothetical protein